MTRRSSAPTCSSSPATGRCTSRRLTRATCWLMLFRFGERLDALLGIEEADIHGEHAAVQIPRVGFLALLLERAAEPVEHAEPLLIAGRREVETAAQDRFGDTEGALLEEADAQHLRRAQLALGGAQRLLQLRDGLVEQAHLLERDTEIVVGLEIGLVDVFVDALLEARQHVLEVLLLVSRRLLVRNGHARVFRRRSFLVVVTQHRPEVGEEGPRAKDTRMTVADEEPTGDEEQDFQDMLARFKQGIDENIDEADFQSHYDLGVAFKEMGLLDEAIAELQKALRAPEGKLRTSEMLGICFFEKGAYGVAESILRRGLDLPAHGDQERLGVLYWLGRALEQQGKKADARDLYGRVFAVDIRFLDAEQRVKALAKAK